MKLRLENFRCYKSREIETADEGLLLLNGASGKGKSTLLNAIQFAVTGEGKNVFSFGTNKCKVELEIGDMTICRTRHPNRLTLVLGSGQMLEDAAAQAVIDRCFGQYFNQTSYIMQGNFNTFLYMSPTAKLEFFENFVFDSLDLSLRKERLKDMIKERSTVLTTLRSKAETLQTVLASTPMPTKLSFPIKSSKEDRPALRQKYERLRSSKEEQIRNLETELRRVIDESKKASEAASHRIRCETQLKNIRTQASDVQTELSSMVDEACPYDVGSLSEKIRKLEQAKDVLSRAPALEEAGDLETRISDMDASLWQDGTSSELTENIASYQAMIADVERMESAQARLALLPPAKDVDAIRKDIHMAELCSKKLSCPSCSSDLSYDGHALHRITAPVDPRRLADLRKQLQQAESNNAERAHLESTVRVVREGYDELYELSDLRSWLADAQGYVEDNNRKEREIAVLKSKLKRIVASNRASEALRKEGLDILSSIDVDERDVDSVLKTLRVQHTEALVIRDRAEQAGRKRRALSSKLDELTAAEHRVQAEYDSIHIECLTTTPQNVNDRLSAVRQDLMKINDVLQRMQDYDRSVEDLKKYSQLVDEYEKTQKNVARAEELLKSVFLLKEKMTIAESMYLERILGDLNIRLQDNLNLFFPEEPIVVSLETFRSSKDKKETKPQINLQVFYKGTDMEVMQLSGGERDRVNLALVMALNELFESPMLLLDECISSLDYDNFNKVIDALQTTMHNKLVLLVCHQAEEGQFDQIIAI